jgi:hypothetical protein
MLPFLEQVDVGVRFSWCHLPSFDRGVESRPSVSGSYVDYGRLEVLGVGCGPKDGRLFRRDLTRADHVIQSFQQAFAVLGHRRGEIVVRHQPTSIS